MSYLKKISFENYRVFDKKYEFEFAPITLVTGPNNSGKSSLTKMLEYLSFASKENNLLKLPENNPYFASWESIVTKNSAYNNIGVYIGNYNFNGKTLDLEIHINQQSVNKIIISHQDIIVYSVEDLEINENRFKHEVNIEFFLEILDQAAFKTEEKKLKLKLRKAPMDDIERKQYLDYIQSGNEHIWSKFINDKKCINNYFYSDKLNKITEFKKEVTDETSFNNIIEPSLVYMNSEIPKLVQWNIGGDESDDIGLLKFLNDHWVYYVLNELFQDKYNLIDKEKLSYLLKNEEISDLDEYQKLLLPSYCFNNNFKNLLNHFSIESNKIIKSISSKFPKITKLRTEYFFKDKIVSKTKLVGFDTLFKNYNRPYLPIKKFVDKQIQNLGIGDSLEIREVENVAYIFELVKNNERYSFQDLGSGYSQIVSIILSIAEVLSGSQIASDDDPFYIEKVVLIEEPEIGLHPNLQAKLADVLAEAISNYSVQFIVETHSEYLIRKLQYLVAKRELKSRDVVIYYFNGEKERKKEGQTCKRIEINKQGILTEKFGEGFFDEATNWQLELIKLNSIQAN